MPNPHNVRFSNQTDIDAYRKKITPKTEKMLIENCSPMSNGKYRNHITLRSYSENSRKVQKK